MHFKIMNSISCAVVILGFISLINGNGYYNIHQPWLSYLYNPNIQYNGYSHPCKRECIAGQKLTCYYEFEVDYYEAAGKICQSTNNDTTKGCIKADGVTSSLVVANKQLPGYAIEICEDDTIIVDVENKLHEDTTIHWHGVHQKKTPYMDGAPYTTQYPIRPGEKFRYKFEVPQHGTFWWHGHSYAQRAYGLSGALIARQPGELNPHIHLYDYDLSEHIVLIQDWSYNFTQTSPKNILINGKGHNAETQGYSQAKKKSINYERFNVVQGYRYRFRFIHNGNSNCPIEVSIDNHELLVISTDGHDMEPVAVNSIAILAAERYDIVFYAAAQVGNYWLRVKGVGFCESAQIYQAAVIHYRGAPKYDVPKKKLSYDFDVKGLQLNPLDVGPSDDPNHITLIEVNGLKYTEWNTNAEFQTIYSTMGIYLKNGFFGFQMDNIYFDMPPVSLLQARNLGIEKTFTNKTSFQNDGIDCKEKLCRGLNVIQIPANKNIEIVASTTMPRGHPIHLHGYDYKVVGMGVLEPEDISRIEEIDKKTPLKRRLDRSPITKDTMQVPKNGYAILRFNSSNTGYWMFHCHLSVHSEEGMMSILKVGENHEMVKVPENNCYDDDDGDDYYKYKYEYFAKK